LDIGATAQCELYYLRQLEIFVLTYLREEDMRQQQQRKQWNVNDAGYTGQWYVSQ